MSDAPTARDLSVDLAEALTLGAGPSAEPAIHAGDRFGRFLVRGVLGVGGMGVVFEAHDPTLDRAVAIKVMATDPGDDPSAGETRMVREAKAMAKLSHPNVVRVYEVGTSRTGLYMVMELIDGATLARWLDEPRPWREVLERFRAAGRGLAAAHDAGLVHRDFKPANVLLGRDGRVLVSDFGLVSVGAGAVERPEGGAVGPSDVSTGVLLGTPRYMAPEQHERGTVDARADQWAYCVSLWEALFGAHPFSADTLAVMVMRVCTDDVPAAPADRGVPVHVREALRRGLSRDPAARFASMHALLAELERDPQRARRRALVGVGAVAVVASAGLLGWTRGGPGTPGRDPCRDLAPPAWGADARAHALALFRQARPASADETFGRMTGALDAYLERWRTIRDQVCRVEDRASPVFLESMSCLSRSRGAVAALLVVFGEDADRGVVDGAVGAVRALPSLDVCRGRDEVQASDRIVRGGDNVRTLIQRSEALYQTGRLKESMQIAARAVEAARGNPGLESAALLALAMAQERADPSATALATFDQAARTAAVGGDDQLLARIWLEQMWALSRRDHAIEALAIAPLIAVAIARIGDPADLRAALEFRRGSALVELGRYDDAETILRQAYQQQEAASGADHPETLRIQRTLSNVAGYRGNVAEALELGARAREGYARLYGPNHPAVLGLDVSRCHRLLSSGDPQAAVDACTAVLPLLLAADVPPDQVYQALGRAELRLGRYADARAHLELSREQYVRSGNDHPWIDHALAELALVTGDPARALALAEQAERVLTTHADRWQSATLAVLARLALGRAPGDLTVLERWSERHEGTADDRGLAYLALGRGLWATPSRRADARRFVALAVDELTTASMTWWRDQAQTWLATHR